VNNKYMYELRGHKDRTFWVNCT